VKNFTSVFLEKNQELAAQLRRTKPSNSGAHFADKRFIESWFRYQNSVSRQRVSELQLDSQPLLRLN
jgi:hypothetical protein